MGGFAGVLDVVLVGLLAVTLVHAVRLQRALGGLRHDRAALHDAVTGFDSGTRQAEAGATRLRIAADELAGSLRHAEEIKGELRFFAERGDDLVTRLEDLLRRGRALQPLPSRVEEERAPAGPAARPAPAGLRSEAERNLMTALQGRRA